MKKRLLSLLLVLAMVFSLMPAALAADKPSFQSFFESVPANAETEPGSPNSTNKWKVASLDGDYVLKSGGAGKSRARSTLQLTFTADAELTFEYKVSSEPNYDYFTITYDGAEKVKESGDLGWKTYTLSAESGKVLTLTYAKDSSGDKFKDCVYVRNFTAGEATVVTFHANGGVGDDYTQNFYGQAALKLNAFTKADGVFAGWATTPDGEVAYTDGAKLNPTEAMDLYAVWTPAYTVTFAYNDGTTADTTVAIACDHGHRRRRHPAADAHRLYVRRLVRRRHRADGGHGHCGRHDLYGRVDGQHLHRAVPAQRRHGRDGRADLHL